MKSAFVRNLKSKVEPDLAHYNRLPNDEARNRQLLQWLSNDEQRQALFEQIKTKVGSQEFVFPSCNWPQDDEAYRKPDEPQAPVPVGHNPVCLVTDRAQLLAILHNKQGRYSSSPYAALGGGNFMLAMDPMALLQASAGRASAAQAGVHNSKPVANGPGPMAIGSAHAAQRQAFMACFPKDDTQLLELGRIACEEASIVSMRAADFDLAAYAEQAGLRFCQKLMGYAFTDFKLLESTVKVAYKALVYQVLGRHFSSDPFVLVEAKRAMALLLARTSALLEAYAVDDEHGKKGCADNNLPLGLKPVLGELAAPAISAATTCAPSACPYSGAALAASSSTLSSEQRALLAMGSVLGTVGNVQAAACIAIKAIMANPNLWKEARQVALTQPPGAPLKAGAFRKWKDLLKGPLAANPPIPFLPRFDLKHQGPDGQKGRDVLLALGAAAVQDWEEHPDGDPLIWGWWPDAPHWCLGMNMGWALVVQIVQHVMALPGLAERLDPLDQQPIGLKQRWGFLCESYPFTHERERRIGQQSLNVAMRIKAPIRDNADRIREVIRAGAPRIEEALRASRHVHFAWFEIIENDSVLVLHTVYDGPFAAYVQHFALRVGELFDSIFESIEDAPPAPVAQFPNEFVALIQRYNKPPTMGYFFSAYPTTEVAQILRNEWARP